MIFPRSHRGSSSIATSSVSPVLPDDVAARPPRQASQESLEKPMEMKLSPAGSGRAGGSAIPALCAQSSCRWV